MFIIASLPLPLTLTLTLPLTLTQSKCSRWFVFLLQPQYWSFEEDYICSLDRLHISRPQVDDSICTSSQLEIHLSMALINNIHPVSNASKWEKSDSRGTPITDTKIMYPMPNPRFPFS